MFLFQTVTILFILVLNFSTVHNQKIAAVSQLTSDIIENERVPSILHAKACWPKTDEISFIKSFSIPTQFDDSITPINLRIDENTNKQWFFIDMNCKQYSNFLSSVDDKYFAHPYRWIIVDAKNESIQHLNLLPGSNIILAERKPNSEHFTLNQGWVFSWIEFWILVRKIYFSSNSVQNKQRRFVDLRKFRPLEWSRWFARFSHNTCTFT